MFDVEKQRGTSNYIVTLDGKPASAPFKNKKAAMRLAAKMNGMDMKEFMRARRNVES